MRRKNYFLLIALLIALAAANISCAGKQKGTLGDQTQALENTDIRTAPQIHITAKVEDDSLSLEAYDANQLFGMASKKHREHQCEQANQLYRQLIAQFPNSMLVCPALYNSGLCYDTLEKYEQAANAYQTLIEEFPESIDVKDALFRLAGSHENQENWPMVVQVVDRLFAHYKDLEAVEQVEALARKGNALAQMKKPAEAKEILEESVRTYKYNKNVSKTDSVTYYSMSQFVLGQLLHDEMRAILLPSNEKILAKVLEEKCQKLLDAQTLYTKVIKIGHPKWAAAAAYKIGSLYHHLWIDMLNAPPPEDLTEEEREIYEEILRKRIKVLLKKAVIQWERTLKMTKRLNLDNTWVENTKKDLKQIQKLMTIQESSQ